MNMIIKHIALVSTSKQVTPSELAQTAAALQKQATRDLSKIWGIEATVNYFPDLKSIPVGYWPIIVAENINDPMAEGYHDDKNNQPFSLVLLDNSWQLTCSHEMCEMLVDPFGNRLATGDSIKAGQGRVQYLVEVCDPCEDARFAYSVNGIMVSDFYTPNYFDPVQSNSVRYSFTGAIKKPRQILKNGYLSWHDHKTKQWFQATAFGSSVVIKPVNGMEASSGSLRSRIDRLTKNPNKLSGLKSFGSAKSAMMQLTRKSSQFVGQHFVDELSALGL